MELAVLGNDEAVVGSRSVIKVNKRIVYTTFEINWVAWGPVEFSVMNVRKVGFTNTQIYMCGHLPNKRPWKLTVGDNKRSVVASPWQKQTCVLQWSCVSTPEIECDKL